MKRTKPAKERELDQAELDIVKTDAGGPGGRASRHGTMSLRPEEEKLDPVLPAADAQAGDGVRQPRRRGSGPLPADLLELAPKAIGAPVQLELELAELDEESRAAFAADLGISGSSRGQTIRDIFYGMGRIVFFTVGEDECRAWAIDKGVPAVEAAGAIHTDLSKGFVRANVMSYPDFLAAGYEEKHCKTNGTLRQESKEYVVQDGDIMHILANR